MKTKIISKRNFKISEQMLTLRVSTKLMNALTIASKKFGLSRSDYCRDVLQSTIDRLK